MGIFDREFQIFIVEAIISNIHSLPTVGGSLMFIISVHITFIKIVQIYI